VRKTLDSERLSPIDAAAFKGLREHVHGRLREATLSGLFRPGERLSERQLAQELGVSTTPVKEALRRLEAEGLVRTQARRGVYVTFDAQHAEEMIFARAAIESMIARIASERARPEQLQALDRILEGMRRATQSGPARHLVELNTRFHEAIYDASGCNYLRRLLDNQRVYDQMARLGLLRSREERVLALKEHSAVAEALSSGQGEKAEYNMRNHIIRSGRKYLEFAFPPGPAASVQAASQKEMFSVR